MSSTYSLDDHILVTHGRWTTSLLADLAAHDGARFVELLNRLGISRDSLTRTLETCRTQGWIVRNPGYGHPLRPEYILTPVGKHFALLANRIEMARDRLGMGRGMLGRWTVPIVYSINSGHQRFNEISRALHPATPRALSQRLHDLVGQELVVREIVGSYPPSSRYSLTSSGEVLANAA